MIADDHPVVRAGLQGMLAGRSDVLVVGEASDGDEAVQRCGELLPDVILMDLRMPRTDGVVATEKIRRQCPQTRVLILTTYDSDRDVDRAVCAGATGYLLKDSPRDELFRAIAATTRGESLLAPAVAARLMHRVGSGTAPEPLTGREREVLGRVARGQSNKEICIDKGGHISSVTTLSSIAGADEEITHTLQTWTYKEQPIPVCFAQNFEFEPTRRGGVAPPAAARPAIGTCGARAYDIHSCAEDAGVSSRATRETRVSMCPPARYIGSLTYLAMPRALLRKRPVSSKLKPILLGGLAA